MITGIFFFEKTSQPLLSEIDWAKCYKRISDAEVYENLAGQCSIVGNEKYCSGDTKGAIDNLEKAKKYMILAVNARFDAVKMQCDARAKLIKKK